ncbi:MAG: hypothetical protein PHO75_03500 [Candidatus Shapirobacteria bacterium]|nr:hypothetical protein [Candidatus Shapirobacteria bacterium]
MNSKFFYFSLSFASIFLIFVNTVSPDSLWSKIVFFFIIFCGLLSISYIFFQKHKLNLILSFYLLSLILFLFFHQFNLLNLIILTALLITIIFLTKSEKKKYKS